MQPERPAKLTFPSYDVGFARIDADGIQVGYIVAGFSDWTAHLWNEAGNRHGGHADAPVTRRRLRDLRADLRERVELKGPWWTCWP